MQLFGNEMVMVNIRMPFGGKVITFARQNIDFWSKLIRSFPGTLLMGRMNMILQKSIFNDAPAIPNLVLELKKILNVFYNCISGRIDISL